jgi:hypothetical protein
MKYLIFAAAVAALGLAGVAVAQDRAGAGPVYGVNPPSTAPNWADGDTGSGPYVTKHQKAAMAGAAQGYKLACAPDRATLCKGKGGNSALECIAYHRLRLSTPCKQALTNLDLAQRGAL